jgi:hypothetical protein
MQAVQAVLQAPTDNATDFLIYTSNTTNVWQVLQFKTVISIPHYF